MRSTIPVSIPGLAGLKRLTRWCFTALMVPTVLLALFAVAFVITLFVAPQVILNRHLLDLGAKLGPTFGVQTQWRAGDLQVTSQSLFKKTVKLTFDGLCAKTGAPIHSDIDVCLSTFSAQIDTNVTPWAPHLDGIGPVTIVASRVKLGLAASTDTTPSTLDWRHIPRPDLFKETRLSKIDVRVDLLDVAMPGFALQSAPALVSLLPLSDTAASLLLDANEIQVGGLAVVLKSPISSLHAAAKVEVAGGQYHLTELGPIAMASDAVVVSLPPAQPASTVKDAPAATDMAPTLALPDWLKGTIIQPVTMAIRSWRVTGPQRLSAEGSLAFSAVMTPDQAATETYLDLGQACVHARAQGIDGCLKTTQAKARLVNHNGELSLERLGPVALKGLVLTANLPEDDAAPTAPSPRPKQTAKTAKPTQIKAAPADTQTLLPPWMKSVVLEQIVVDLDRVDVHRGKDLDVSAHGSVLGSSAGGRSQIAIDGAAAVKRPNQPTLHASAKGHVEQESNERLEAAVQLDLREEAHHQPARRDQADASAKPEPPLEATLSLHASDDREGLKFSAKGNARHIAARVSRLDLNDCHALVVRAAVAKDHDGRPRVEAHCDFGVSPAIAGFREAMPFSLPDPFLFSLIVDGHSPLSPTANAPMDLTATLAAKAITLPELQANAQVKAHLAGTFDDFPANFVAPISGEAVLGSAQFEDLVKAFAATPFAVPAPFNALRGGIDAHAYPAGDPLHDGLTVPFVVSTRLKSKQQVLTTDTKGTATLDLTQDPPALSLDVKADLTDIQLELPNLSTTSKPPNLVRDNRIEAPQFTNTPPSLTLHYHVLVSTPEKTPLRLVSNLTKTPIPIAINYDLEDEQPTSGTIDVKKVTVSIFRREAVLDYFNLKLGSPDQPAVVNGKITVDNVETKITIEILGTTTAPIVKIYSNPPKTDRELAALLLFGRDMDEVDDSQMQSADAFRAAAADGALTLASMYVLASTPIQSIGYDPQAKAFTAQIEVAKGTSLDVGSDFGGYQKVGVQKRLGHNWSIETYNQYHQDTDQRSTTALLQWSKRY